MVSRDASLSKRKGDGVYLDGGSNMLIGRVCFVVTIYIMQPVV